MIAQTFIIEVHTESDMAMTVSQVVDVLTGYGWDGWMGEEGERPTPTGWIRDANPGPGGDSLGGLEAGWNDMPVNCDICGEYVTEKAMILTEPMPARLVCDTCALAARERSQ